MDNASGDGIPALVAREAPEARYLPLDRNVGFAAGANRGISATRAPWVLLMNPDVRFTRDGIAAIAAEAGRLATASRVGILGPRLLDAHGLPQPSAGPFPSVARLITDRWRAPEHRKYYASALERPTCVDWVTGACLLARRECLEDVGFLDEGYFLYYEDVDLCRRARARGWEVWYSPAATATHLDPYAGKRGRVPEEIAVEVRRSHLRYARLHQGPLGHAGVAALTAAQAAARVALGSLPGAPGSWRREARVGRRVLSGLAFGW